MSVVSRNTSEVEQKQRVQYWTDSLKEICGRFKVDPLGASFLNGRISYIPISCLRLCDIEVSGHRIEHLTSRTRTPDTRCAKILFQTHGISYFEQDGRRVEVAAGDCLAYDVSRPHNIVSPSRTRHEVVIVPVALLEERELRLERMTACKLSARTGSARVARDFVHMALAKSSILSADAATNVANTLLDVLLTSIRDMTSERSRCSPATMRLRVHTFILENLRDPDLNVERISGALGCTKRYLHMLFSDSDMTISDYIWQARLNSCRQELETRNGKSVTQVSFSWGFSSSSHFSRTFRKQFGVVPSSLSRGPAQLHRKAERVELP